MCVPLIVLCYLNGVSSLTGVYTEISSHQLAIVEQIAINQHVAFNVCMTKISIPRINICQTHAIW